MPRKLAAVAGTILLGLLAGCDAKDKLAFEDVNMPAIWGVSIPESTFTDGGVVPKKYAAPSNVSPPLAWRPFISAVAEYVVFVEDVDAKDNPTTNWIVFGIPPTAPKLEEGASTSAKLLQGINSKGTVGYTGMDPDSEKPHRYAFEVFALLKPIGITEPGADKAAVLAAMKGKVVAKSVIYGVYQK
jgi:Raf kinase inhibitor-like YbhB/YbcL family protein